jgi:hypothetical protein
LNSQLGTRILINRAALEATRDRVVVETRDAIAVKSKAESLEVFELPGLANRDHHPIRCAGDGHETTAISRLHQRAMKSRI